MVKRRQNESSRLKRQEAQELWMGTGPTGLSTGGEGRWQGWLHLPLPGQGGLSGPSLTGAWPGGRLRGHLLPTQGFPEPRVWTRGPGRARITAPLTDEGPGLRDSHDRPADSRHHRGFGTELRIKDVGAQRALTVPAPASRRAERKGWVGKSKMI